MTRLMLVLAMLFTGMSATAGDPKDTPKQDDTPKADAAKTVAVPVNVKVETSLGDFVIELNAEKAPITVENFLRYVNEKYYDGTTFHFVVRNTPEKRIIGGTVLPNMDKKTEGLHPPIKSEWGNGLKNLCGTVAMVRKGMKRDSAQAEFFINASDNPSFDPPKWDGAGYTVFGKIVSGMNTIEKILGTNLKPSDKLKKSSSYIPVRPVIIKSASVVSDRKTNKADDKACPHKKAEEKSAGCPHAKKEESGCPHAKKKSCPHHKPVKPAKPSDGN